MSDERYELPEGWAWTSLGGIIEFKYGKGLPAKSRNSSGHTPVYGSNGIVGQHDEALTASPVIVVGRKGSVGEVHISSAPCWPIDTTYFVDNFPSGLDATFLFRYLRSQRIRDLDRSTAVPGINREDLYRLAVPIPPLPEQRRIVAKIEALFEQGRTAREALDRIPSLLKKFRQAVLSAAFRGDLTRDWREQHPDGEPAAALLERIRIAGLRRYHEEVKKAKADGRRPPRKPNNLEPKEIDLSELPELPAAWKWVQLPFLGELSRGKSKHRPRNDPSLFGGLYPFIQTGDIARSGGQVTSYTQAYNELGLAQSRLFPARTVCITIAANIADSAVLTFPACFPDSVVGFIPDRDCCDGQFVEYFIRTIRENLARFAPATAQKNINLEILGEIAVPTPPIPEQREIVRQIGTLFALADSIEAAVQAARRRAVKLEQSILARAFRGELVPQDPNDDPPRLLERIRAQGIRSSAAKRPTVSHRKGEKHQNRRSVADV